MKEEATVSCVSKTFKGLATVEEWPITWEELAAWCVAAVQS